MRRAIFVLILLSGCHKEAATPADPCAKIETIKQVMSCELGPYSEGKKGDEAAFRLALQQLRELSPSDPEFQSDPGWPQVVDGMLQSKNYKQGCRDCHTAYIKPYRAKYGSQIIAWTDVHAAKP